MNKKWMSLIVAVCIVFTALFFVGCTENPPPISGADNVSIIIGEKSFEMVLYDNETVNAFKKMLPMTLDMSDMEHEKYYYLPQNLPIDSYSPGTINVGDVMLYGSNCLVIFYETFNTSYTYTRIGRISNTTGIGEALGSGKVTIKFELNLKNPEKPTIPNEPDQPTVPTEPDQPTRPNEPEQPTVPNEPDQPTEPSEPEQPTEPNEPETITKITISINGTDFKATIYDNQTAQAFVKMLPMTMNMSDMPHEKYYYLPQNLPTNSQNIGTIREGDLMLWGSNCFVLFYETFNTSYSYTPIGRIDNTLGLAEAIGRGTSITFVFD